MSEVGWYRIKLSLPVDLTGSTSLEPDILGMLRRSVEMVAQSYGGHTGKRITSASGQEQDCLVSIHAPALGGDISLDINSSTGALDLVFDRRLISEQVAQDVQNRIVQNYAGIAVIRSMRDLGYDVIEEPSESGVVRLIGTA